MKTRLFFAALLLLAFGSSKAQDTITVPVKADTTIQVITPDMLYLNDLMRILGENLQHLSDSVDWENFERDMEQWGADMEEWGRKMEEWGKEFEDSFDRYGHDYGVDHNYRFPWKGSRRVNAIKACGSGDVVIQQFADHFALKRGDVFTSDYVVEDGTLILSGSSDYEVAIQRLDKIQILGSGDVFGRCKMKGKNLHIVDAGSGDLRMNVEYDTIYVRMSGSGDVTLQGQCKVLYAELSGSGDLDVKQLLCEESHTDATGSGEVIVNKSGKVVSYQYHREQQRVTKPSWLLDPHWQGFDAGLNMFIDPSAMDIYTGYQDHMAVRPLRSWYFGFNIADVGIAFDRKKKVGMFTGVGLGWHNYSWKNYIRVEVENDELITTLLPDDHPVKNSKLGILYLQVPLMVEVRPTRHFYIDLGVTGGIRLAGWTRIKYEDGSSEKSYSGYTLNLLKCDASLRAGSDNLGFFINYALVPSW